MAPDPIPKLAFKSLVPLFLLLPVGSVAAQDYYFEVEKLAVPKELSSFSGTCILQDSDGFMWFGSNDENL